MAIFLGAMTFNIMTLSIKGLFATFSIKTLSIMAISRTTHNAETRVLFVAVLVSLY